MSIEIRTMQPTDFVCWDSYVSGHYLSTPYHFSGWQTVIEETYGHKSYFLLAKVNQKIVGILPLVHMKHQLSGNCLVSMPFLDMAGVLADNVDIASSLLHESTILMHRVGAEAVELRQGNGFGCKLTLPERSTYTLARCHASGERWRMTLELPDNSKKLMNAFPAKLRSQIRKPIREGLKTRIGGIEFLEDFYHVFSVNMRDLGSPVHSKYFIKNILDRFEAHTRIFVVYKGAQPLAASLIFKFAGTVYNPWASSLRKYRHLSPNMLLYWSMLEFASDLEYRSFDFGRSTEGEGTYRFKKQWGANPNRLCWFTFPKLGEKRTYEPSRADKAGFKVAVQLWKRMPVPISLVIGPAIRKHIGL